MIFHFFSCLVMFWLFILHIQHCFYRLVALGNVSNKKELFGEVDLSSSNSNWVTIKLISHSVEGSAR